LGFNRGKDFERETANLVNTKEEPHRGIRVIMSGAVGTITGNAYYAGDAVWKLPWLNREIRIECKHGYDRSKTDAKSMTIFKDWFDKHIEQAKAFNFLPVWAFKFKFTQQNGMSKMVVVPFPVMKEIITQVDNIYLELEELRAENEKLRKVKK